MVTPGLIQMRCAPSPAKNFATALTRVRQAARRGAQIVCLPELFRTRSFWLAEDADAFTLAKRFLDRPALRKKNVIHITKRVCQC